MRLAVLLSLLSFSAFAQTEKASEPKAEVSRKFDLNGTQLEGGIEKPALKTLYGRPRTKFDCLIKVRLKWDDEMQKSADLL